jgi:hypothetical protein
MTLVALTRRDVIMSEILQKMFRNTRGQCYKTFCPWITDFRTNLVFVKLNWKKLTNDKHLAYYENS